MNELNSISPVSVFFPLFQNLSPNIKLNLFSKFFTTSSDSKFTIQLLYQLNQQTNTTQSEPNEILEKGVNIYSKPTKKTPERRK